jgi:hypothetical protein
VRFAPAHKDSVAGRVDPPSSRQGLWRVETRVSPSESGPVNGHSGRTGDLHALFPAAARRQSSGGASRPVARNPPSRPRPRVSLRPAAGIRCDGCEDVRKGRGTGPSRNGVGVQWKLPAAVARRDRSHSVSFSAGLRQPVVPTRKTTMSSPWTSSATVNSS